MVSEPVWTTKDTYVSDRDPVGQEAGLSGTGTVAYFTSWKYAAGDSGFIAACGFDESKCEWWGICLANSAFPAADECSSFKDCSL